MPESTPPTDPTRTALITGPGSGIGREIARVLSHDGFACILCGRREAALHETAAMLGTPSLVLPVDLSIAAEVERIVDRALAWRGSLDAIVNNAGWSPAATIAQTSAAMIHEVFALNAIAPALTIARVWPALVDRAKAAVRGGGTAPRVSIVNISSMAVKDPFPQLYAYAAAKASTHLLAKSAANEGKGLNIHAFAIAPGAVETALLRTIVSREHLPSSLTLSPRGVAAVVHGCIRGEHDDRNGEPIWLPSPTR